jgi:hypothetical protein
MDDSAVPSGKRGRRSSVAGVVKSNLHKSTRSQYAFASREKAILSQWRWVLVSSRRRPHDKTAPAHRQRRALEVLLGADDIPGDLAERYGYVNRAFPDAELDSFVEALSTRIASFDKQATAETKRLVNIAKPAKRRRDRA